ncbi:NRDE family protein [Sulfidibacter corallicola]|uniref:NRDE family protein n=1 Tax=Sulfidibacter corallicola TaxID=2818388 RepID=A0A8A4TIA5_SULCO|nr:NRDE family protein [Sulfidibacter corallicola]QTD49227.1 NRDE family protein [Sulfidibacter corallicola]
MCIIFLAYQHFPRLPLVLVANRDEFYGRPALPLAFWEDEHQILAGRDGTAGGSWLGVNRSGRVAAITNIRNPAERKIFAPSRGLLVRDFLRGHTGEREFMNLLLEKGGDYNGFNLIFGTVSRLYCYDNRTNRIEALGAGIHGLSNDVINTPWPKVAKGKRFLDGLSMDADEWSVDRLFELLGDREQPDPASLPDTGIGPEWERLLSPIFIVSPIYGSRCGTVLTLDTEGGVYMEERTYFRKPDSYQAHRFQFTLGT